MSNNYSAQQYSGPFCPKRLRNWTWHASKSRNPVARCGATCFIATDRGHLLHPNMKNPNSSPWGSFKGWIWEEQRKCSCMDAIKNPQFYDRPPCDIVVVTEKGCPTKIAGATCKEMVSELFKENPEQVQVEQKIRNIQQ